MAKISWIKEHVKAFFDKNNWSVEFLEEAKKDLKRLDRGVQTQVVKGIKKIAQNPVSIHEGGYGKPLGNKNNTDLTGLFKIKYSDLGIRVVYRLEYTETMMKIIVISARTDEQVYKEALRRRERFGL